MSVKNLAVAYVYGPQTTFAGRMLDGNEAHELGLVDDKGNHSHDISPWPGNTVDECVSYAREILAQVPTPSTMHNHKCATAILGRFA